MEAVATLFLAFVALFQDMLRKHLYHPILKVTTRNGPPDCVLARWSSPLKRTTAQSGLSYYLRLKVENTGNDTARDVEVYATKLMQKQKASGEWELVKTFPPMNLVWSNTPIEPFFSDPLYLRFLAPDVSKYCDIAHISEPVAESYIVERPKKPKYKSGDDGLELVLDDVHPQNPQKEMLTKDGVSLEFDLIQKPNNRGHIVEPGIYRLDIVVAASNAAPIRCSVIIDFKGWVQDEVRMFSEGVDISVVK